MHKVSEYNVRAAQLHALQSCKHGEAVEMIGKTLRGLQTEEEYGQLIEEYGKTIQNYAQESLLYARLLEEQDAYSI